MLLGHAGQCFRAYPTGSPPHTGMYTHLGLRLSINGDIPIAGWFIRLYKGRSDL